MSEELRNHYVAFLDLLGFSSMVRSDSGFGQQNYLGKLFKCHQSASQIFSDDAHCQVTQFSDSIVFSKPYEPNNPAQIKWFAARRADYQRLLLEQGLLCRGGIAVNKHFSNGTFTLALIYLLDPSRLMG